MANPVTGGSQTSPSGRSRLLRCIVIIILLLIILIGLAVLVIWLTIRPRHFVYTIEEGSINDFALKYNHLNASFYFLIRAHNPNTRVSLYYDSIKVSVLYDDDPVAFYDAEPFYQPRRNVTRFGVKPVAQSVPLAGWAAKDLRLEKNSGAIELRVRVKARIRFKVGIWKSSKRTLRVKCSPVVHVSSWKNFKRTSCDTDI